MNDLSIRVSATDMASNVLAAVGDNVKNLGQTASSAFDQMSDKSREVARSATTVNNSSTMIIAGTGPLGLVAKAIGVVGGAAIAAGGAIIGIGVAALNAAAKAEREISKVGNTLKLIEAQKLNVPVSMIGAEKIKPFTDDSKSLASQLKTLEGKNLNVPVSMGGSEKIKTFTTDLKFLANQLETMTGQKSSAFVGLANDALMKGFDSGQMDSVLKAASSFSFAFGTSLEGGLAKAKAAAEGNFEAFENLIPGIEKLTTNEAKLAAVNKLATDAFYLQTEEASKSVSMFTRLSLGTTNFLERLGSGAPIIEMFSGAIAEIAFPIVDSFVGKTLNMGEAAEWTKGAFKTSFANIATVIQLAMDTSSKWFKMAYFEFVLFLEGAANEAEHIFVNRIPGAVETTLKSITNLFSLLSSAKNGPGAFFIKLDNLTPDYAKGAREKSVFEKQLEKQLQELRVQSADEFKDRFLENIKSIDEALSAFTSKDHRVNLKLKTDVAGLDSVSLQPRMNQALESRVMARGPLDTPLDKIQKSVDELVKLSQRNVQISEEQLRSEKVANAFGASNSGFGNAFADIEIEMSN